MLPLRVVFLWHYHQPDYRWEGQALLPWVRLRAVKDYALLFRLFGELRHLRSVLNVVPSLLVQLTEYATAGLTDLAEQISEHALSAPGEAERQYWSMLEPPRPLRERFPVMAHLWERFCSGPVDASTWRDVLLWTQLVWAFPHRKRFSLLGQWFHREGGFHSEELKLLLQLHRLLLREALQALSKVVHRDGIELSCSPWYHPVLPLVCDTGSAAESDPGLALPEPAFRYPHDAWLQCVRARQYCAELLGVIPEGMWAPEGAVSAEALSQMAAAGVRWTATDEAQLFRSMPSAPELQKYLPHRFFTPNGEIVLFFRDRQLSDALGFQYGGWEPERAVQDFCQRLLAIRQELIRHYGESILRHAAVLIALDGENCWDSYSDNGVGFLRSLDEYLQTEERLVTTTCREVIAGAVGTLPGLSVLRPGSWVGGSLRTWIGTAAHNAAWEELSRVRQQLERLRSLLPPMRWREALEHLLAAEGSDWFWWWSPEHGTPAAPVFERLFQLHLQRSRELMEGREGVLYLPRTP